MEQSELPFLLKRAGWRHNRGFCPASLHPPAFPATRGQSNFRNRGVPLHVSRDIERTALFCAIVSREEEGLRPSSLAPERILKTVALLSSINAIVIWTGIRDYWFIVSIGLSYDSERSLSYFIGNIQFSFNLF